MAKKRQTEIAGTERDSNDELDELFGEYLEAKYERIRLQVVEKDAHEMTKAKMKELGLETYVYADGDFEYENSLSSSEKIKTKRTNTAEL